MPDQAPQIHTIGVSETRNISIDVRGKLDTGELLTGTPAITEVTTSALTLSSKQISTAELTINGGTVAIAEAIQVTVAASGASVGRTYVLKFVCGTTESQTISGQIVLTAN